MFKSQKEMMQALMEGKRIRKDAWWSHCYLYMDEDGMIYDEESHQYTLKLSEYASYREVSATDFQFMKYLKEIDINKLSCVTEDLPCSMCKLYVNNTCVKANLMNELEKCQNLLED